MAQKPAFSVLLQTVDILKSAANIANTTGNPKLATKIFKNRKQVKSIINKFRRYVDLRKKHDNNTKSSAQKNK